jgi:hypothetical protein
MKIMLKGILAQEDAKLAADYGTDGIIISNHSGPFGEAQPVQDADRLRRHIDGSRRPLSVPAPARRHRPRIRRRSNDTGGSEAGDVAADHRDPERRGQWLFVACQCASASCGFEIAGSMISPCFPVLAVNSMTYPLGSRK